MYYLARLPVNTGPRQDFMHFYLGSANIDSMTDRKPSPRRAPLRGRHAKLVTEIVAAYVSKNPVAAEDLPGVIKSVHATLGGFGGEAQVPQRARGFRSGDR